MNWLRNRTARRSLGRSVLTTYRPACEDLEARLVLCADELGVGHLLQQVGSPVPASVQASHPPDHTGAAAGASAGSVVTAGAAAAGLAVPALNSLPGAPAMLYYPGKEDPRVGRTILSDRPGESDRIVRPTFLPG